MGINNEDKIVLIDIKISNLDVHISILNQDILDNPEGDVEGKPIRQSVLEEFQLKRNALVMEKETLTNQG